MQKKLLFTDKEFDKISLEISDNVRKVASLNSKKKLSDKTKEKIILRRQKISELIKIRSNIITGLDIIDEAKKEQEKSVNHSLVKEMRHISSHLRKRYISPKNRKYYIIQKHFSSPKDYREFAIDNVSRNTENELISTSTILNPALISNNFIISLGLISEKEFNTKTDLEKTEIKKLFIPEIKELFINSTPLPISSKGNTSRILTLDNPTKSYFGKILLSQKIEGREDKNRPCYKDVISVYDDIYSLIRSQGYTVESLQEERMEVLKIRKNLEIIIANWGKILSVKDNKTKLTNIKKNLVGCKDFLKLKILIDRLSTIDYKNGANDIKRLQGALRDSYKIHMMKYHKERLVAEHGFILNQIKDLQMKNWKDLNSSIIKEIGILNNKDKVSINSFTSNDKKIKPFVNFNINNFKNIKNALCNYINSNNNINFRSAPFVQQLGQIIFFHNNLQKNISNINTPYSQIKILKNVFFLNLSIKIQAFLLFIYELEHDLKQFKNLLSTDKKSIISNKEKDDFFKKIEVDVSIIEKKLNYRNLLENIVTASGIHIFFVKNNKLLHEIRILAKGKKLDKLIELLEKIKKQNIGTEREFSKIIKDNVK